MKKKIIPIIMLLILLFCITYYNLQPGEDYLPKMKEIAGQGCDIKHISGQIYEVSQNGETIGFFDQQNAIGYAGQLDVLVFVTKEGQVKNVTVVNHIETPSFFNKVIAEGFVKQLQNKEANSRFKLDEDLDGVTNATYTSRAIAEAVRKASYNIAVTQLNMEVPRAAAFKLSIEHYLVLALLAAVFISQKLKWPKLRYLTLLLGFILIGYWQKSLLSLGNFSSVISGSISLQNIPFWLVLLFGIFLLIIISGRNLYCFWICPYGAISELLGTMGKFCRLNYTPGERSRKRFKHLRLFLAWGALVFAFLKMNPSISSYEVFAPLFAWEGSPVQWFLLPLMLFVSIFIFRFWCRFFCPVGGILDFLVTCRKGCVQWLKNKLKIDKTAQLKPMKQLNQSHQEANHQEKA